MKSPRVSPDAEPSEADSESGIDNISTDIQAVGRTAQILSLLGPHREQVTAQEVAGLTTLNRTTAHRYLVSMEQARLLERTGSTYTVGPLAAQLSSFYRGQRNLLTVASMHMTKLVHEVKLTSALTVFGATGPVVVHVEEDRTNALLLTVPLGTQLDLLSAHAQIWLAFGTDPTHATQIIGMLPPTQRDELTTLVAEARESRLGLRALDEAGYVAISAPIWSGTKLAAVIALMGTPIKLPARRDGKAVEALAACAAAITKDLS